MIIRRLSCEKECFGTDVSHHGPSFFNYYADIISTAKLGTVSMFFFLKIAETKFAPAEPGFKNGCETTMIFTAKKQNLKQGRQGSVTRHITEGQNEQGV